MNSLPFSVLLGAAAIALGAVPAAAAPADAPPPAAHKPAPPVWMMTPSYDNGRCFRALFEHPEQWAETRSLIAGIGYADHCLRRQFTDDELRAWLPKLRQWNLGFELEVGAIKEWAKTGDGCFKAQDPNWQRFEQLGARIYGIAMDEPLCAARKLKETDAYAVEETAKFIALVRKQHPTYMVGDIEPYPFLSCNEIISFVDGVNARLKEMGVRGLDFLRIDPDWAHPRCSWPEVKAIESECRRRHLKFSLIYWAADWPSLRRQKLADDSTWYASVIYQTHAYDAAGGAPDECMVESWLETPTATVPDSAGFTFTQSVRDFARMRRLRAETGDPDPAPEDAPPTRIPNVVYGRKAGMALTMEVVRPAHPCGIGVIALASGGWHTWPEAGLPNVAEFNKRGQTAFLLTHSSAPRFTINEIPEDITRAIRFIRTHAADYGVDPDRLAIMGMSSGGHLSLMAAARGDDGDPKAQDPVARASSRVQAVACFCPPADFVNYGAAGVNALTVPPFKGSWPTFGIKAGDPAELAAVAKAASPINYMTKEMPPTLIFQGDADPLVPLQQAQEVMARLQELGVPHELQLRPGKGHGWPGMEADYALMAAWFEKTLKK